MVRGTAVRVGSCHRARALPLGDPPARRRARLRRRRALRRRRHARSRPADVAGDRVRALADGRPRRRHGLSASGRGDAAAADPRGRPRGRAAAAARVGRRRPDRRGTRLRRSDRALRRRRRGRAGRRLRRAQEHRRLPQRTRDPPLGHERRRPRRRSSASAATGVTRVQEQALVDFLLLRALPVARRDDLPVQLHAGYGDRDLDLRLVNPLHLRGMLSSEEAKGVHFVVLHAAWPFVREGAFMTAVYSNVTLDIATCIPPLGHAALLEAWRCALSVGATQPPARLDATRPACPSTSRSEPAAHARRSARCWASSSRAASSPPVRQSAAGRRSCTGIRGGCTSVKTRRHADRPARGAPLIKCPTRLQYFRASQP